MGRSNLLQTRSWESQTLGSPCADCEIRSIGICASLKPDELERMHRIVKDVRFGEGQLIFSEGDPADSLFNVLSGAVRLIKMLPDGRRQITGFLLPGAFLGIALNSTYAYSAEAIVNTKLCRFGRREVEGLLKDIPNLEHRLLGEAANELVAAQDQMLLLGRKTAKERLASFLVGLSRNAKRHGFIDNPVALPMSRTDIADFLGLTTETVSRTFTRLRQSKIVALEGNGMVRLMDIDALDDLIAGGDGDDA
jgi:CRP/FNR family transcriptional regulator